MLVKTIPEFSMSGTAGHVLTKFVTTVAVFLAEAEEEAEVEEEVEVVA